MKSKGVATLYHGSSSVNTRGQVVWKCEVGGINKLIDEKYNNT